MSWKYEEREDYNEILSNFQFGISWSSVENEKDKYTELI